MTGIAGSAVAAGALLGGVAAAGSANADPGFDPSTLPSCLDFVAEDGSKKPWPEGLQGCKPVDIYAPGMTLAQRKAFVNSESPNYARIIADLDAKFDAAGNPKSGGYPVTPWDK
ncbi:hypothetical protein [Tsukamurella sp. 1534]|uniref:hypothetical protein n=1 Tax=Tsukamurella sp. 1534 TaxID=1151061 RepID=UPI0002E3C1A0|nr:hypothetical protein [Tsukamurella sp. 1534]